MCLLLRGNDITISAKINRLGINNEAKGFHPVEYKNAAELWAIIRKRTYSPIIFQNNHRLGENYIYSDLCILDVDNDVEGAEIYTVEHAVRDFQDCTLLIASTRSHNLEKHGIVAPRFRILIPWETRITCPYSYEKSIKYAQGLCDGSDKKTKDIARQFYPSYEVLYSAGPGEKMPVSLATHQEIAEIKWTNQYKRAAEVRNPLPGHVVDFLTTGKVFGDSRNVSVYTSARLLIQKGLTIAEVEKIIEKSPFDRNGFRYAEFKSSIKSAEKKER
jgi:hypothetical protein